MDGLTRSLEAPDGCTNARSVVWIGWAMPPRRVGEILEASGLRWRVSDRAIEDAVVCFAPGVSADLVTRALGDIRCPAIVHGAGESIDDFAELLAHDRLFYVASGTLSDRDLATLIESAAISRDATPQRELSADVLRRIALAQSLNELASAIRAAIVRTVSAERGRCLLFDRDRQVLWSPSRGEDDGESIAAGLASFVLRTAAPVSVARLEHDPRFDSGLDNPEGRTTDRSLVVPVITRSGETIAVLVALRASDEAAFDADDEKSLEALATHVAPYLDAWMPRAEGNDSPFRAHALREHAAPALIRAEPLRLDPRWMRAVPMLIAASVIVLLVLAMLFRAGGVW